MLASAEAAFALGRRLPVLANARGLAGPVALVTGLVDLPAFAPARGPKPPRASAAALGRLDAATRSRTLVLVEDSFTASFDGGVPVQAARVLAHLGYRVFRLPPLANGKLLHLLGQRDRFARIARRRVAACAALASGGVRLVGLDPVPALMFEQEYREFVPAPAVTVSGLEAVLAADIAAGRLAPPVVSPGAGPAVRLFGHCTESALRPEALDQWRTVLGHFGIAAQPVRTGCCGMAGLFGHEADRQAMSRRLFDIGWRPALAGGGGDANATTTAATGFSCREQTRRLAGFRPPHPIELLSSHLLDRNAA